MTNVPAPADQSPADAKPGGATVRGSERVSIPGKVMLSGEYSVLGGGTAVMLPVPRWLHASRAGLAPAAAEVPEAEGANPVPPGDSPVVQLARRVYLPEVSELEHSLGEPAIAIDGHEFTTTRSDGVHKLGLGSSAAEAVGVVALRYLCAGLDWAAQRSRVQTAAQDAHTRAQGGLGSGADIAACTWGRPLLVSRQGPELAVSPVPPPVPGACPPLALVWTGFAADSRQLVKGYLDWRDSSGHEGAAAEKLIARYAGQLAEAWFTASRGELYALLDVYSQAMQTVTEAAGLVWRLPAHVRLELWARRHGGRAKPTGAGGGDMALLIGDLPLHKLKLPVITLDPAWLWEAR